MTPYNRSNLRRCSTTHLKFTADRFPYTHGVDYNVSVLGKAFKNVSQRARNGRYHEAYCRNHNDRYTRVSTAIGMDPSWVNDPTKFAIDIVEAIGVPLTRNGHKLSLDRIDNERGYFIGNLRWATALEQAQNKTKPLTSEQNRFF